MADKESEEGAVESANFSGAKQQGLFGSSGIELTEEEISSSVTHKFLRHINSQQEDELVKLRSFQTLYYDKRQDFEVLKKEKENIENELKQKKQMENLQKVMITFGSLLLGSLKLMEQQPWYFLFLVGGLAAMLIIGGMFPVLRIGSSK
ncbi:hypothetical protein KTE60_05715 [Burkholderia multivorans]|uniref:hypothetical protein n=1 Tax=Burkholderia cepacia complex TaxID=87882 RepID=UPI000F5E53AE|nr:MULTISPECIES: hypothetical protein [Burkholderia cepacia complex]MBU9628779.1 hypothetical protein [Burkholderia multivorans]